MHGGMRSALPNRCTGDKRSANVPWQAALPHPRMKAIAIKGCELEQSKRAPRLTKGKGHQRLRVDTSEEASNGETLQRGCSYPPAARQLPASYLLATHLCAPPRQPS